MKNAGKITYRVLALWLGVMLVVFFPGIGDAIPQKINYQGYLTNAAGVPINGNVQMVFAIYDALTSGTKLWEESHTVAVTNGVYNVILGGDAPPNPITLSFDIPYYLGIRVGTDPEMIPRQPLVSAPYAFRAETADTVFGSGTFSNTILSTVITGTAPLQISSTTKVANLNVDLLDGQHASDFLKVAGDTMTGALNLPANGLVAGTNQFVLSGGNVGIGTASPSQKLEVSGNMKISGSGNALAFPDGTTQTTAVSGGGGGVPSGFMILGNTSTAPSGFTYTGKVLDASWTVRADMPTARGGVVGAVVNNKIYVIGGLAGSTPLGTNEEYDPATNTWTVKASMDTARYAPAVGVVNDKIYIIGGTNSVPFSSALPTNEVYDPVSNTWAPKAGIPVATAGPAAAVVNGKLYVIGGNNGVTNLANNQEYDPVSNSWAARAAIPSGARIAPGGAAVNNKIYVIGGVSGATFVATNEEYNPATNNWTTKASMLTAREVGGCALPVVNNRIYVIGGSNGANASVILPNNEEYNPATNTWTVKASMPTARRTHATAAVDNKIYAIGGNDANMVPFPAFSTNEEYTPGFLYVHKKD